MPAPLFNSNSTKPFDKALREGKRPDSGTLGVYPRSAFEDPRDNMWRAQLLDNPKVPDFFTRAQFGNESAAEAYNSLRDLSVNPYSSFQNPNVRNQADDFLDKYALGVGRIIDPKTAVLPENIALRYGIQSSGDYFIEDAKKGNANIFPSRGPGVA